MKALILTSSPASFGTTDLYQLNGLPENLARLMPKSFRLLYITSDPSCFEKNDMYGNMMRETFEKQGYVIKHFVVLDNRNSNEAEALIKSSDMVFLCGGHVPTQNRFFHHFGLKELLKSYEGVVMSLSAGSMNAASDVYCAPEEPGEAVDPLFVRDLEGLGLININIMPHWQYERTLQVDNLRVEEDILLPDSYGRQIYTFNDGTYMISENGCETIYGECSLAKDGKLTLVCRDGESYVIPSEDEEYAFPDTTDLTDGEICLRADRFSQPVKAQRWVPAVYFTILLNDGTQVGYCDMRFGYSSRLFYGGHIGYGIKEEYRGRQLAAKAVRLLLKLARKQHMPYVYITCDESNIASARTCEIASGHLINTLPVPKDSDLYKDGVHTVKIYRFETGKGE